MSRPLLLSIILLSTASAEPHRGAVAYEKHIRPILEQVCFDCHAGGVALDPKSTSAS